MLVDENPPDPAYWQRNVPRWYGSRGADRRLSPDAAYRWLAARPGFEQAADAGAEVLTRHAVWGGFYPGARLLGVFDGSSTWQVEADQLILATGTTDLHLAFPGWTLGGVLGGGGALDLLEVYGHLDGGKRMVILGSGNLARAVALAAQTAEIDVVAMVDIREYMIRSAEGRGEVELVRLESVHNGVERVIEADTLCVAIGRQAAVELPYLLGCELAFDPDLGGPFPLHDSLMRTTREGVLVAGDLAGANDATFPTPEVAEASGISAARGALAALGGAPQPVMANGRQPRHSPRATSYLTEWHRLADAHAADDLIICRCEEITRGQIMQAVDLVGANDPDEIKRVSRAGMGVCQGRGCRPIIAGILASRAHKTIDELPFASFRPPIRAVPLNALATVEERPLMWPAAFKEAERRLATSVVSGELNPMAVIRFRRLGEEALYQLADAEMTAVDQAAHDVEARIRATQFAP